MDVFGDDFISYRWSSIDNGISRRRKWNLSDAPKEFWMKHIIHADELLLVFSVPVDMLTLTPDQAREMAGQLMRFAESVSPKGKMS